MTSERLLRAFPLVAAFLWLCFLYGWEAWKHGSPWLFIDELQLTELARSIAETGKPALRGEPSDRFALSAYLVAPAWLLDPVSTGYSAAKYIGVVTMSASIFPAYGLARTVVSPAPAVFAAIASACIPAFVYTSFLVEEPLAYPWATLCLYLIVRALTTRDRRLLAAAAVASAAAPLVRDQLAVVPAVFLVSAAWLAWTSDRARAQRAGWNAWDRAGAGALLVGAVVVLNEVIAHRQVAWEISTRLYKDRMLEYGLWAGGALTIGLGVFPVVAALTGLWLPRRERRSPAERAFTTVFVASLAGFGFYAAVKAAYLSHVFGTRVVERNMIYLAPLLFAAAAVALERRRVLLGPLAGATVLVGYLIVSTPYNMETRLYSDAPGLAILAAGNRELGWTPEKAETVLLWLLAASVLVLLALVFLRARARLLTAVLVAAAVGTIGWNVTGAHSAATGSNEFSRALLHNFPSPPDWLDRATGGEPALFLGQQVADANGVYLLEFWNRSLKQVWAVDGTAPGPGPTLQPNVVTRFGDLSNDPHYKWAVVSRGVELVGRVVLETKNDWKLVRIAPPLRLRQSVSGIYSDGWMGQSQETDLVRSTYSRFSTPGERAGTIYVGVSRRGWCGPNLPGRVTIEVGPLAINENLQPTLERVTEERGWVVASCAERTFAIPTPTPPFHVEVEITPPFVPRLLEPKVHDTRYLGAQLSYSFVPSPR